MDTNNSQSTTILIIDDDVEICDLLKAFLIKFNYTVLIGHNKKQMQNLLENNDIHLIILDVMMPQDDGLELCREFRKKSNVPIIMLTADSETSNRILGLEYGADDYIIKPYEPRELLARIKAVLRRFNVNSEKNNARYTKIIFCRWSLNKSTHRLISPAGMDVSLSSGDYDLLLAFLEHPQRVLSRDFLMELTRSRSNDIFDRSIDNAISRLRRKIEINPQEPELIKTIRSSGYMLVCSVNFEN